VLGLARPSAAQQGLPDALVTKSAEFSESEKGTIRAYVDEHISGLSSGDALQVKRARNALTEPLLRSTAPPSQSFRTEYAAVLLPKLQPLAKDKNDVPAVNAVRIAGVLGTKSAVDMALEALADPRPGVRVEAARSVGLAISTARGLRASLLPRQASEALDGLDQQITREIGERKDPRVLDAMMEALDDAMKVGNDKLEGVQAKAAGIMLKAVHAMAGVPATPAAQNPTLAKATDSLIRVLTNQPVQIQQPSVREAAGVAGDVVAMIVRRIDSPEGIPAAERPDLALIAGQCERIVQRAATVLGSASRAYKLEELLLAGDQDAKFKTAAGEMFTDLIHKPFEMPADRYPRQP